MLKQIIFHIEEAKDQVQLNFKEVKRKNKRLPSENLFHFTEFLEKQKVENEVDLGLVLEIAEKKQIFIQSNSSKLSRWRYEKNEKWFFLRM